MWYLVKRGQEIIEMLKDNTSLTEEERKYYRQLLKTLDAQYIKEAKELSKYPARSLKEYQELHSELFPSVLDKYPEDYDPKRNYDFSESITLQNIKKRLLDYFKKEGFSI